MRATALAGPRREVLPELELASESAMVKLVSVGAIAALRAGGDVDLDGSASLEL
ncbi:hypothetical protein ACFPRL_12225 [Pseudoclavibacter helvolus]